MRLRHLWPVAVLVLAGCASDGGGVVTVGGVELVVPDGWTERPTDTTARAVDEDPDIVASGSWGVGEGVDYLQVLVGCDGTAADLARAAAQAPRDPLVVTDAEELAAPSVPGLDAVHRLRLVLGAGRPDDARTVQVDGLYGQTGDAIVLVELAQRAGAGDTLADEVLGSVDVASETVRAACDVG